MDRDYWFRAKGICGKETVTAKETQSASTNIIRLHRVLRAAPKKGYRAFVDAEANGEMRESNQGNIRRTMFSMIGAISA
jgi:hypothetical protein